MEEINKEQAFEIALQKLGGDYKDYLCIVDQTFVKMECLTGSAENIKKCKDIIRERSVWFAFFPDMPGDLCSEQYMVIDRLTGKILC